MKLGESHRRRRDEQADRRAGRAAGQDRRRRRLGPRPHRSRSPWTRCAARRATPTSTKLSGGERAAWPSAASCSSSPDMLLLDEPTNHLDAESVAWLERHLARVPRHRRRGHPRSLLPRQRRRLDPRARPRRAASPARATTPAGSSRSRSASTIGGEAGERPRKRTQRELEWVRMSARRPARPRARPASRAYEKLLDEDERSKVDTHAIDIPAGQRLGNAVIEAEGICARASATAC